MKGTAVYVVIATIRLDDGFDDGPVETDTKVVDVYSSLEEATKVYGENSKWGTQYDIEEFFIR
jgi:hypothetical protein